MEIKLSIVVPCYNEEAVLHDFYREITKVLTEDMKQVKYEIIFVDDGSKDTTVEIIEDLSNRDGHVQYVSFPKFLENKAQCMQG